MTKTLEEAKSKGEKFLLAQFEMINILPRLNPIEILQYNAWYDAHPYHLTTVQIVERMDMLRKKLKNNL